MAGGVMFWPKGTQVLAPANEKLTLASLSMLISSGKLKRISTFWFGIMTRLPAIARSLKLDLRSLPGTAWVFTRCTA